jgi:hypothetical protein
MNTWNLVDIPDHRKLIDCKWVYKIKLGPDGTPFGTKPDLSRKVSHRYLLKISIKPTHPSSDTNLSDYLSLAVSKPKANVIRWTLLVLSHTANSRKKSTSNLHMATLLLAKHADLSNASTTSNSHFGNGMLVSPKP